MCVKAYFVSMYVCKYVCMCTVCVGYMNVCMCVYVLYVYFSCVNAYYVSLYVCMYVCMYVGMYVFVKCACILVLTNMWPYIHLDGIR